MAAFAAAALAAFGQMQAGQFGALAADPGVSGPSAPGPGTPSWGDLSPAIAKKRPSASVPADLPNQTVADCRLLEAMTVYRDAGPGTTVAVPLGAVMNRLPCADPPSEAGPYPTRGRPE